MRDLFNPIFARLALFVAHEWLLFACHFASLAARIGSNKQAPNITLILTRFLDFQQENLNNSTIQRTVFDRRRAHTANTVPTSHTLPIPTG